METALLRPAFAVDPLVAEARRRTRKRRLFIVLGAVAILLIGGGGAWTALVRPGSGLTPAAQAIDVAAIEKDWYANLRSGARLNPGERFPNPSKSLLLRRLRFAASRYHFTIQSVRVVNPAALQAAPRVVVETADEQALSRSVPAILKLIDPRKRVSDDRRGWAYEGFLFQARNTNGVPFLATFNWWRSPIGAGGGQAASSETLYPFVHG